MKISELKKQLKSMSKDDLIKDIVDLYRKNEFVKDYFESKLDKSSVDVVLEKYKDIIKNEFFPDFGDGKLRLSVAKKAITEYKKISDNKTHIAELMISYVENGVNFTSCYGDIDEKFYYSMESMYDGVLKHTCKYKLETTFRKRCKKIVIETEDMGWGFHDTLSDMYYSYYDE